jgi:putative drug exporter of the RND superfamily
MKIDPETIARASSRHPGRTLGLWAVVLVAGMASAATLLGPALTTDFDFTNAPEAKRAAQILEERRLEEDIVTETVVIDAPEAGAVDDQPFVDRVNDTLAAFAALGPDVVQTVPQSFPMSQDVAGDPAQAGLGPIPSQDGDAVLFTVVLAGDTDEATENFAEIEAVRDDMSGDGADVYMLGQVSSSEDFKVVSEEDLRFGESIGVLAAIIVLIVVFGALVAGLTPIVMGIFAIVVTLGVVGLFGLLWDFSFFTPNLISMMGLAVGIDYSLFIVSRYREERGRGRDKLEAIAMSGATANRAVFFSGLTVVLALAGMLLVPTTIFRSLAGGAIIVVIVSVAASMTLLPAILSLLGDGINKGRIFGRNRNVEHGRPGGFWDRATRAVMARPVVWLVAAAGLMIALSMPYWLQGHPEDDGRGIKTGLAGIGTLPDETRSKQAFNLILEKFPELGSQATAEIVVVGNAVGTPGDEPGAPGELAPEYDAAVDELAAATDGDPTLGTPAPARVNDDGSVAVVSIPLAGAATDAQSEAAVLAIDQLRTTYVPQAFEGTTADDVLVGGESAFVKDFFDISDAYTPIIILVVLALSFVLLTVVFRSLVVPAKAIVMNLLSVGAAYGLIVLVFQKGGPAIGRSIADLFGFAQVDAIEAWLPLFLFSILFGLSMDYHVFLLTRIREEYDRTKDNAEAVAFGLRTTGGIITGAAIIMVAVFGGFAAGRLTSLEQMGFGLAVAVFLDATVVRSILVPATMRLLGDRNWYLPSWLAWLPNLDVEGHGAAHTVTVPDTPEELVEAGDARAE